MKNQDDYFPINARKNRMKIRMNQIQNENSINKKDSHDKDSLKLPLINNNKSLNISKNLSPDKKFVKYLIHNDNNKRKYVISQLLNVSKVGSFRMSKEK